MNHNFYQYALGILDNLSVAEMEAGLRECGIEFKRKVIVFSDADINELAGVEIATTTANARKFLETDLVSIDFAANDNSYALAA
ncbi:hypothetical protein [Massilia scottii]|uniref:hypothetical protein n=1 Tax=Massilia scottii TaxID=3057166 RepID=UPI002796630F|nr:hypothetical protein [Massilia sp. CCM 9029]MDQ1834678.1 hypothetical protein [Massilia sp. CCM 9029]